MRSRSADGDSLTLYCFAILFHPFGKSCLKLVKNLIHRYGRPRIFHGFGDRSFHIVKLPLALSFMILKQAQASPKGLTRASIIEAARDFTYTPLLAREGVVDKSKGESDPYLAESLQVLQYDATAKTFKDIGPLVTEFETP